MIITNRDTFPDSDETDNCIEGAKTTVCVNRFERSSIARQKCIESKWLLLPCLRIEF